MLFWKIVGMDFALAVGFSCDVMETFEYMSVAANNTNALKMFLMRFTFSHTLLNLLPFYIFQNSNENFWKNARKGLMYSVIVHYFNNFIFPFLVGLSCIILQYFMSGQLSVDSINVTLFLLTLSMKIAFNFIAKYKLPLLLLNQ